MESGKAVARGRDVCGRRAHNGAMSSRPAPEADDLPDSLPEDAAAQVRRQNDGVYTAETPERREQADAPSTQPSEDDE